MIDAVAVTASSMSEDLQRLAMISNNLANTATPGFKRDIALYGRFARSLEGDGFNLAKGADVRLAKGADVLALGAGDSSSRIDQQSGSLRFTGNPFDIAIEGPGFFELGGDEGQVYTRQGDFHMDARGRLVNATGLPVMGTSGEIFMQGGEVRIERDGRIFENDKPVAQLRIAEFERPDALRKAGNGVYATVAGQTPKDGAAGDSQPQVRQAHLENSNVVPVSEMVLLIETVRHFESQQKLIQGYDEMLEHVIRTLGEA